MKKIRVPFLIIIIATPLIASTQSTQIKNVSRNWHYTTFDSIETKSPPANISEYKKEAHLPHVLNSKQGQVTYYQNTLPPLKCRQCSLFIPSILDSFTIWIDGHQVYQFGNIYAGSEQIYPGMKIHMINVEHSSKKRNIIIGVNSTNGRIAGINSRIYYGERSSLYHYIFKSDLKTIILLGSFSIIALISIFFFVFDFSKILFLSIFLFATDVSIWFTTYSSIIYFLQLEPKTVYILHRVSSYLLLPIGGFVYYSFTEIRLFRWISWATLSYSLTAIFFSGTVYLGKWNAFYNILVIISVVIVCIYTLFISRNKKLKRTVYISFLLSFPFAVHDALLSIGVVKGFERYTQWGVLLFSTFILMMEAKRFTLIEKSVAENEKELTKLQLNSVMNRLNPHFILNTLGIIMEFIKYNKSKAIQSVQYLVDSFTVLMINYNKVLIPLNDEIKFTSAYCNLLLLKYSDALSINFKVKINSDTLLIPPLTIQPLVENAYKHGIRKIEKGKIKVTIENIGDNLKIQISNTSINNLKEDRANNTLSIIESRLKFFYDPVIFTMSNKNNQTVVDIEIGFLKNSYEK